MLKIEIKDVAVEQKSGTARQSGKPYTIRTQSGWTSLNGETRRVPINLERDQPAYEVGQYVLADSSFIFGDFGRLMLGRLELQKVALSAARVS
jgi:hypothetical protein